MLISIVINADTRPERNHQKGLFSGVINEDFLTDGVFNKIKFFDGFEKEVILFIDKHMDIPQQTMDYIKAICDTVVVRKHTDEPKFNDFNYIGALQLARGEIVVHFDQDCAAFTSCAQHVQSLIDLLDTYDYVSYPSRCSPNPVHDPNYDYFWVSTRFFMCRRQTLDFTEIAKCLTEYEYLYNTYPASVKNPWTEHVLGLISKYKGKGVYYPPIETDKYAIFCWANYDKWILRRLNDQPYEEIRTFIDRHGGIQYPNDIFL